MNKAQKDQIRLFIVSELSDGDVRLRLDAIAQDCNCYPFEAMEFYENEVERINKLFNYPGQ